MLGVNREQAGESYGNGGGLKGRVQCADQLLLGRFVGGRADRFVLNTGEAIAAADFQSFSLHFDGDLMILTVKGCIFRIVAG